MLQAEMPFGSWRESELDTCAKIAKGQMTLPQSFSSEAADLITKVLLNHSFLSFSRLISFVVLVKCEWGEIIRFLIQGYVWVSFSFEFQHVGPILYSMCLPYDPMIP